MRGPRQRGRPSIRNRLKRFRGIGPRTLFGRGSNNYRRCHDGSREEIPVYNSMSSERRQREFIHDISWIWNAKISNKDGNVTVTLTEIRPDPRKARIEIKYEFPPFSQEDIFNGLRKWPCDGVYGQPAREGAIRRHFDDTQAVLRAELESHTVAGYVDSIFIEGRGPVVIKPQYFDTFDRLAEEYAVMRACRAITYDDWYGGLGVSLVNMIRNHELDA